MNKFDTNFLEISRMIDPSKNLLVGKFSAEVNALESSTGKARNLNEVLFFLTSYREREYTPSENPTKKKRMSKAEEYSMKHRIADSGKEYKNYSEQVNGYVFSVPKSAFLDIVGTSYEDTDLQSLLGKNANEVLAVFIEDPSQIVVDEITAKEFAGLDKRDQEAYSKKRAGADGEFLTCKGQQIFRTTELHSISWETEDNILPYDQDLKGKASVAKAEAFELKD